MSEPAQPSLAEKVLLIEAALQRARVPHAFGGAIALAYYGTPRGTLDIDLNAFVGPERSGEVLDALQTLGAEAPHVGERVRLKQLRIGWGAVPIDLFFSYDPFHEACLERRRRVPFGEGESIHVLAPEDLVVFKAIFSRDEDWRDIAELAFAMAGQLDADRSLGWLDRIVGNGDERYRRCAEALSAQA